MVAAWNTEQKDAGSIVYSVCFTVTSFSNRKEMGSNPVNSKSVNSFYRNKKISHLSSLLQYNYLHTKNKSFIFFFKIFFYVNNTTPSPNHYPSYANPQCRNIEKRSTQAKTTHLCWSISNY